MVNLRVRAVGSTLARSSYTPAAPYRWRGVPGWDPAAAAAGPRVRAGGRRAKEERAERVERYRKYRANGDTVAEAGARLGLALRTAQEYESIIEGRPWKRP
jgi:hypothetical protein